MASSALHRTGIFAAVLFMIIFPALASGADGSTGSGRIESGQCPADVESSMVYSPFKAYFYWPEFQGDIQKCWVAADCLLEAAGESRKQQFAAVALVMGLIPLTLKDIAWPERRIIHVTNKLYPPIEILVLALGLVPLETTDKRKTRAKSKESNLIATAGWRMTRMTRIFWIVVCLIVVLACYAGMSFMEIYSKRSALGCVFPVTVVAWYFVALLPASIHALFAALRRSRFQKADIQRAASRREQNKPLYSNVETGEMPEIDPERKKKIVSAVQGADEDWPVQLSWGVYYIAGTLIFTSIMAVTVIELVCWVGLGFAVTGSSKLLAFFLCMVFEETDTDWE
ncbi:hypothetical protein B0J11DRAFT_612493 [Dendryphion nanum]|uniref:Uncharacterized protein n=1 Tax=Dendryphion nanum TaxID=256645 RepID=A0A9P9E7T6_9PLEO|nr:hypothetical protein B0J11DRAFT_612493 [Dendryphion nanum]